MKKKFVLFLCTHNAARSQMAEGILNHFHGDRYAASSAGIEPGAVHPLAVEVMREWGIDLSAHRSKHVGEFAGRSFDIVVTVCDNAKQSCPVFPGAQFYIHHMFPDPSNAPEPERLEAFRRTRNEINTALAKLLP